MGVSVYICDECVQGKKGIMNKKDNNEKED